MEFYDYPRPLPFEIYEEAAHAYAALVAKRVHGVYRSGSVTVPGISDLDMIVVPLAPRYDNYAYFSLDRLPEQLRPVFRHHPFVLPLQSHEVLRYSSHTPRLVLGRDVLPPRSYELTIEDRWSTLLEDYCHYRRFMHGARDSGRVSVRFLLSKVTSIRFPVDSLNALVNDGEPDPDTHTLLERAAELRQGWFESSAPADLRAAEGWQLITRTFARTEQRLRAALELPETADLRDFAHAFLRGDAVVRGLDTRRVQERQRMILAYLNTVCAYQIRSQPLVANTLYRDEVRRRRQRYMPHRAVRAAVRLQYLVDGVLRSVWPPVERPLGTAPRT